MTISEEILELITTLKNSETNDIEFRNDLADFAPSDEIELMLRDKDISPEELVGILETYKS